MIPVHFVWMWLFLLFCALNFGVVGVEGLATEKRPASQAGVDSKNGDGSSMASNTRDPTAALYFLIAAGLSATVVGVGCIFSRRKNSTAKSERKISSTPTSEVVATSAALETEFKSDVVRNSNNNSTPKKQSNSNQNSKNNSHQRYNEPVIGSPSGKSGFERSPNQSLQTKMSGTFQPAGIGSVVALGNSLYDHLYTSAARKTGVSARNASFSSPIGDTSISMASNVSDTTMGSVIDGLYLPGFLEVEQPYDYQLGKRLAEGAHGAVFEAKILSKHIHDLFHTEKAIAKILKGDDTELSQEIAMMYYFRESPLFAKLYAFDTMNRTILMKHYELKSLKKLLKNRKITYHRTLFVPLLKDVSMALREMHLRYMVHRDIKPDNVLIDIHPSEKRLMAVLADFGVSASVDPRENAVKAFKMVQIRAASLAYSAPEAIKLLRNPGYPKDGLPADVYSFGSLIYEVLIRKSPWSLVILRPSTLHQSAHRPQKHHDGSSVPRLTDNPLSNSVPDIRFAGSFNESYSSLNSGPRDHNQPSPRIIRGPTPSPVSTDSLRPSQDLKKIETGAPVPIARSDFQLSESNYMLQIQRASRADFSQNMILKRESTAQPMNQNPSSDFNHMPLASSNPSLLHLRRAETGENSPSASPHAVRRVDSKEARDFSSSNRNSSSALNSPLPRMNTSDSSFHARSIVSNESHHGLMSQRSSGYDSNSMHHNSKSKRESHNATPMSSPIHEHKPW